MHKKIVLSFLASTALLADTTIDIEPITVTYKSDKQNEKTATYSTDFYSAKEIEALGAKDIYELLSQSGFVSTAPSYGNKFSYVTDIRGYGLEKGSQNVGIFIDGVRRRSIDMAPITVMLPLEAISSVEISRGGGSPDMMEGANSGSVKITTKEFNGINAGASLGTYGYEKEYGLFGISKENYSITAGASSYKPAATREMPEGKKDDSIQKAMFVKARIRPLEFVEIGIQKESSDTLSKYSGAISESVFLNSPSKMGNWSKEHRYQDRNGVSLGYDNGRFASNINIFNEQIKSRSNSATWGWGSEYKNKGFEYSAEYSSEIFKISGGLNGFYGERIGDTDTISKNNVGAYLKPSFAFGTHTLSLGFGAEKIAYSYMPNSGAENRKANSHSSQELGYNYALSKNINLFANYSNTYLAPDIDRFFDWGGAFNGLIETEESKTYTIGGGYYTNANKLKFSLFYVKLKNEIYYNPATWTNTNLDRSSKRGVEISDKLAVSDTFSLYGAYSYVDAKIDSEGGNNNKTLPGVSKHSISAAIFYTPTKQLSASLSHKYKSEAYTYDDFSNSAGLRQKPYNSTDAKISYRLKNAELYASVSNIFGVKNGLYTSQTSVYPTDFNTLYICGANIKF